MKPSTKSEGGSPTCMHSSILRRMPPLRHSQDGEEFFITHSDVCRFILLAIGLNPGARSSWAKATRLFKEAGYARVLVFDHATKLWQGCDYRKPRKKEKKSPRVVQIMDQIHRARLARNRQGGRRQGQAK